MQRLDTTSDFFAGVMAALRNAPPLVWAGFVALGVLSAVLDWAPWSPGAGLTALDYAGATLLYGLSTVMVYVAGMLMIDRQRSWRGLGRFLATLLLMLSPVAVALALLVAQLHGVVVVLVFLLLLLGLFLFSFLQGWPILQATSPRWIGPRAAWATTKGLRWQLFLASVLLGAGDKLTPDLAAAHGPTERVLALVGGGLISILSLALAAAVSAQAWRHMQARLETAAP